MRGMPDCQYSCVLQGAAPSEDAAAGESNLHKAAVEAYLEQTAIKQAEKDLQRQQMPSPPDAAVNFSPAVGEPTAALMLRACTVISSSERRANRVSPL